MDKLGMLFSAFSRFWRHRVITAWLILTRADDALSQVVYRTEEALSILDSVLNSPPENVKLLVDDYSERELLREAKYLLHDNLDALYDIGGLYRWRAC